MLDKIYKLNNDTKKGKVDFSRLYGDLYLQRLGSVQNYSDRGDVYIEQVYQNNPIGYAIIQMAASLGSSALWGCYDYTGKPIDVPGLNTLMYRPTPDKTWRDYIQDSIVQKMLTGNAFSAVSRFSNNNMAEIKGKPRELFILPSNEIQLYLSDTKNSIESYVLDFHGAHDNPDAAIKAKDVLHIKNTNPDYRIEGDFLWGQSKLRPARRSIQTYNETLETGVWYIQNKGIESILVNKDADLELSPEAVDQLKDKLRLQAQGPKNAGNVPIIDADLEAVKVGSNPDDILLLPLRIQAAREICAVFNFPCKLIGLDDSTYQNAKEAKKALWENVIIPELDEIKAGLNRWLVPMYDGDFYLDYNLNHIDALQEDRLMRGKAIKEYAGMITVPMALEMAQLPIPEFMKKEPTNMDEWRDMLYLGFTQAVVTDQEEISDQNGTNKKQDSDEK